MTDRIQSDTGAYTTRDYRVTGINLINAEGVSIEISNLVVDLQLRQDLFVGFMSGEMLVADGIGLFNSAAMRGSEYLGINLLQPGKTNAEIKRVFRIHKVSKRASSNAGIAQSYIVHFLADEMVQSNLINVSKAYKKTTISRIVEDITLNYMSLKNVDIENTTQQVDVIIPSWRPTKALRWLSKRAENGKKHTFMFYQDMDGYHFRSLHSMYEDEPAINYELSYQPKNVGEPNQKHNLTAIDSYKAERDCDVLSQYRRGGTSMRLLGVDPIHRVIKDNELSLADVPVMDKFNLTDDMQSPVNTDTVYTQYDARRSLFLQTKGTSTEVGDDATKWIRHVQNEGLLNNNSYTFVIPGNFDMNIGKTVWISFPNYNKSARYLIVGVVHVFNFMSQTMDTQITVTRDSAPELNTPDRGLPTKMKDANKL
jgi:hypothetical protein